METDQMKKKLKFTVTVTGAEGDEDCTINMKFDPPVKYDEATWEARSGVSIMAALIIQAVEGARDED
jgi:metal-sulfur cluster biosynthetic enzyme